MATKKCGECLAPTAGADVVHQECYDLAVDNLHDEVRELQDSVEELEEQIRELEDAAEDFPSLDPFDQLLHELRYRWLPNYRVMCDA